MNADPNKKSARSFQCRDVLWETFEQMARELECSVDYLINEAMKQYARQRGQGGRASASPGPPPSSRHPEMPGVPGAPGASGFAGGAGPTFTGSGATLPTPPPPRTPGSGPPTPGGGLPPPPGRAPARAGGLPMPPPSSGRPGGLPTPPPLAGNRSGGLPPPPSRNTAPVAARSSPSSVPPRSLPPPLPRGMSGPPPLAGGGMGNGYVQPPPAGATLAIVYQGEKVTVNKDRFVIGRGKQSSDLTLKDPNVSRQHAMVEFQNGVYFMVDMGSTNGVEFNGQRIARKQIAEGDVFRICDHDLFFTYR